MATTLTDTTFLSTYKDDFKDSDGYHRVLFNSGVGLQARELTQLQTILQNQISRLGDNIFKEGAVVKPGGVNVNPLYEFIKLDTSSSDHQLPTDLTSLIGTTATGRTSGIVAEIIEVVAAAGSDPATLYVKYTTTSPAQSDTDVVTVRMQSEELLNMSGLANDLKVQLNTLANPATGVGTRVTLLSGIYYARNNFVFTENQSKIISKYTDNPTTDIGFISVEDVVSASDNNSLYDNQGTVPNVSAPGADRYRIRLTIAERSDVTGSDNFIHVATIKKGRVYNAVSVENAYNIPNDVVAKRIFENSGDYEVKPFKINFDLDSENTHLLLNVSDGVVVVNGYRAARSYPSTLRVAKPIATLFDSQEATGVAFGNHVLNDPSTAGTSKGLPNINTFEKMNLRSAADHGGSTIGTARIKAVSEQGADIRFHLMDIQLNSGQSFRDVKSIGTSTSNYFDLKLENSKGILKEPLRNTGLFKVPFGRPQSITDISYTAQRRFQSLSANGSGVVTLTTLTAGGEVYTDAGDWKIAPADSAISTISPTVNLNVSNTGGNLDFGVSSGFNGASNLELLAYVQKGQASVRSKQLVTSTVSNAIESDGSLSGFAFINLEKPDIFDITSAVLTSDSNVSVLDRFDLDNGQRDTHYGLGRLVKRQGRADPVGDVSITFRHFTSTGSGDFFAVNSYTGVVDYDKIPNHTLSNGQRVNLRDFLDFRPVVGSKGSFDSGGPILIEQPKDGTVITSDVTYNLAQSSKLLIDEQGIITLIKGQNGFNPDLPNKIDGTLPLYDIIFNAATLNESDLSVSKINHKRFTMRDIGRLEKRVDNVEEITALSLLELNTNIFKILDSAGNDRTKSGFIVDNFVDATGQDFRAEAGAFRAALDPQEHCIRPAFAEDNLRIIYDSDASTNTIKKGDNIYIKHNEETYIDQSTASDAIKINPFSVTIYDGTVTLSPSSDEYRDVDRRADKIIKGGSKLSTVNAFNWNNWSWNWGGTPIEDLRVGSQTNQQSGIINKVVSEETVLELIEDRIIETATLPFMRARKIFFKAEGLRPNTLCFPFLDGVNIGAFTKGQTGPTGFQFYTDSDTDVGNTLTGLTEHPQGSNSLVTDANGIVSGSFIVPNNDNLRIRTGTREFKIMDISVDRERDAAAIASTPYAGLGFLDTKEAEYTSTRQLNVQGVNVYNGAVYNGYGEDGGDGIEPGKGTTISIMTRVVDDKGNVSKNSWTMDPDRNFGGHYGKETTFRRDDPRQQRGGGYQVDDGGAPGITDNNDHNWSPE